MQNLGLDLSLYLAASGLGFKGAEKGTALWHEVIVSRLVQQISTLVTRPAREEFEHVCAPAKVRYVGTADSPNFYFHRNRLKEGSVFFFFIFSY